MLAALLCIALTATGLARGAEWLTAPVPGAPGLPLGNLASWLSLVSLAWLALRMAGEGRLRVVAIWLLVLACSWLPVSALVAGNWALSFKGSNGLYVMLGATALLALSAVLTLLAVLVFYLILTKLILSPVRRLRATTEKVHAGDLTIRSQIRTGDEFEQLAESFNTMLDQVEQSQAQLRSLNESLDLKISELSEANIGLYESNRLKSEFLANVSHELRTPLNSIIGFAEVLQELARGDESADPKRLRYINNILTSGRSLLEMINELLEMAKIEAGRLEVTIEPSSLSDLIEGLTGIMRPQAEAKQIQLKTQVGRNLPMIETDPGKLQQILYNFLSNAVKFTPSGGTVTITADRLARQDKSPGVRLGVSDTGPGIPYDMQDAIFEKFRQVDAGHTREHPGTGLGLAICRELADLLGASVSLVSEPGRGATFFVDLPLAIAGRTVGGPAKVAVIASGFFGSVTRTVSK